MTTHRLARWEIQLLVLVAKNRRDPKARELLREFPRMSRLAKSLAERILTYRVATGSRLDETVRVFIRRAEARRASRRRRQEQALRAEAVD